MRTGLSSVAVMTAIAAMTMPLRAAEPALKSPDVVVRESHGEYAVVARFHVARPVEAARAVLTDYERIPQFMPGVETSLVVERAPGRVLVLQEAMSRMLMFSKRVHLVLEIHEAADSLRFRDTCGRSFRRYEGEWRLVDGGDGTDVTYTLVARPNFDVPEFLLKRLLKRDSGLMMEGLRREIERRDAPAGAAAKGIHD